MKITKDNAIALLCCAKTAMQDLQEREAELGMTGLDVSEVGTMDHIRHAAIDWQGEQIQRLYIALGQFEDDNPQLMNECYRNASPTEKRLLGIED